MSEPNSPLASSTLENFRPPPERAPPAPQPRYLLPILLLLATCFTTLVMGARMQYNFQRGLPALSFDDSSVPFFPAGWAYTNPGRLLGGLPFMATLMFFFLAHEMGHYLYCRRYGVYATLPFFIPMPTPIGTMGAVILIRSRIRSRTALFDIGIAGPTAGFVVALGGLVVSLAWSKPMQAGLGQPDYELGYPLIFKLVYRLLASSGVIRGPAALTLGGILFHPTTIAAWVGMLATSLNLLPGGQLDGGHIIFAVNPRLHRPISMLSILILLPLSWFYWAGWLLWAVVLRFTGSRHPDVPLLPALDAKRRALAWVALIMLALTLIPAPFGQQGLGKVLEQYRAQRQHA